MNPILTRLEKIAADHKFYEEPSMEEMDWLIETCKSLLAVNQKLAGMINPYHDQDCSDSDEEFGDDECCECGATERARMLTDLEGK